MLFIHIHYIQRLNQMFLNLKYQYKSFIIATNLDKKMRQNWPKQKHRRISKLLSLFLIFLNLGSFLEIIMIEIVQWYNDFKHQTNQKYPTLQKWKIKNEMRGGGWCKTPHYVFLIFDIFHFWKSLHFWNISCLNRWRFRFWNF